MINGKGWRQINSIIGQSMHCLGTAAKGRTANRNIVVGRTDNLFGFSTSIGNFTVVGGIK